MEIELNIRVKFKHACRGPTKREPSPPNIELKYTQKKVSRAAVIKVIRYRSETERFNEILSPLTIPSTISNVEKFSAHLYFFRFIEERYQKRNKTCFQSPSISKAFFVYTKFYSYRRSTDRLSINETD